MQDIQEIYARFLARRCTTEEAQLLMEYFRNEENAAEILELIQDVIDGDPEAETDPQDLHTASQNWTVLDARIQRQGRIHRLRRFWISAAASLLLITAGAVYYYKMNPPSENSRAAAVEVITPGTNRATMTLADGSVLALSEGHEGIVIGEKLAYDDGSAIAAANSPFAILTTPRGGQYRVTLSDGTKVWLNAASSLHYPTHFHGDERKVTLVGEAYFEVAHNPGKPFIVYSGEQRTVVKGTKFNVSAYPEDHQMSTTLLEGSVAIQLTKGTDTEELLLKPDQQAVVKDGAMRRKNVDASEAMAWSQGKFMFTGASLPLIMRQIARWYDVDVTYRQPVDDVTFTGSISRFENIEDVLRKLALTGRVKFETKERRIVVMRE